MRLPFVRCNLSDGAQASFREEVDLVIRQVQQNVKDYWCELQQIERLSDSCSRHTQMFGQVCLGGASTLFEKVFENERLFHRIDKRYDRFSVGRSRFGARGFNIRYEKLALVQSRKVNPEDQIEKVRESFGRGEPDTALQQTVALASAGGFRYVPCVGRKTVQGAVFCGFTVSSIALSLRFLLMIMW